jgi:hypothetical protein
MTQPFKPPPGQQVGIPPWHMWGSEGTARLISTGAPSDAAQTVQLARVHYKRPETWEFLIWINILEAPNAVAGPWDFHVDFEFTVGVGRTVVTLPLEPFVISSANLALFAATGLPLFRFATAVQLKPINEGGGTNPNVDPQIFDHFPAQDIQANARMHFTGGPAVDSVLCSTGAFFSPRTHIRPDWFAQKFMGGEGGV